jgi:hypothetical protein
MLLGKWDQIPWGNLDSKLTDHINKSLSAANHRLRQLYPILIKSSSINTNLALIYELDDWSFGIVPLEWLRSFKQHSTDVSTEQNLHCTQLIWTPTTRTTIEEYTKRSYISLQYSTTIKLKKDNDNCSKHQVSRPHPSSTWNYDARLCKVKLYHMALL